MKKLERKGVITLTYEFKEILLLCIQDWKIIAVFLSPLVILFLFLIPVIHFMENKRKRGKEGKKERG